MSLLCNLGKLTVTWFVLVSCLCKAQTPPPVTTVSWYQCSYEITIMDPLCGLTQDDQDDYNWQRQTSDNPSFKDPQPTVDHTTHIKHGHYLYAPTGNANANGNKGQLNLPTFSQNTQTQCLEFFYQIGGDNAIDSLSFNMYQWSMSSGQPSQPTWSSRDDTADVWTRVLYTIKPQDDVYMVIFEAVAGTGDKTFIALDDVSVNNGECPFTHYNCSFETGMGGLIQDTTDDADWFRQQGSTSSQYTGPSIDHTLGTAQGWYVYIEASFLFIGKKVRLITPVLQGVYDGSPDTCVIFFYHMYGTSIGDLSIFVKPVRLSEPGDPVWSLSGNRGDRWRGAEVFLTTDEDFQVIFEATRGQSFDGDMALDDIEIARGASCRGPVEPTNEPNGACTFEEVEICYYYQDQTDDADWIWQNRANQFTDAGPNVDHTTNTEFGFYMFLNGDVGHSKTARLISPTMVLTGPTCVEFYYNVYGNDDQTLKVYRIDPNNPSLDNPLVTLSGNHGQRWRRSTFLLPSGASNITFEGRTGIHSRDEIAIDDIGVYATEQCPPDPTEPPATTTPTPTNNIGCNFEAAWPEYDPFCGWVQDERDGFDWTLNSGPTRNYQSGPKVDHTLGTDEGHYMLVDSYERLPPNARSQFISPLVATSSNERCFKLWYFMNGYSTDFLNFYVRPQGATLTMDPVIQIYGNRGSLWQEKQIPVPAANKVFRIIIEGTVDFRSYSADIAIDDFTLVTGACTASTTSSTPSIANCNFEGGLCGYTQADTDVLDDFDWFLSSGSTGTDGTGPSADHTLGTAAGKYLYMEASQPRRPGDMARIISPVITRFNETYCLEFFYHMSGDDTASLVVKERGDYYLDQEIARLTGPVASDWKPFNVDVARKFGPIEIVFEGNVGNDYRGDIALDDITLTPKPCGGYQSEFGCSFEYGYTLCNFEQSPGISMRWKWFDGLVGATPPIEWSGSFMYAVGENRTSGAFAVFKTPMMTLTQNDHCLAYDYALADGMKLDVVSEGRDGMQTTLQTITTPTSMSHAEYRLPSNNQAKDFRILMIATTQSSNQGLAVVDNVYVNFCNTSMQSSGLTVAVVLGILLGVAALALIAMGVLYCRKKNSVDLPTSISYKNNGVVNTTKPDLSTDPGIDNPNYTTAELSSA